MMCRSAQAVTMAAAVRGGRRVSRAWRGSVVGGENLQLALRGDRLRRASVAGGKLVGQARTSLAAAVSGPRLQRFGGGFLSLIGSLGVQTVLYLLFVLGTLRSLHTWLPPSLDSSAAACQRPRRGCPSAANLFARGGR
jgi:hypothetical protein